MKRFLNGERGFTTVEKVICITIVGGAFLVQLVSGSKMIGDGATYRKAHAAVAAQSPAAKFGVELYRDCMNPGFFSSNPAPYCRQMVEDVATKQQGTAFAKEAVVAVDRMLALYTSMR